MSMYLLYGPPEAALNQSNDTISLSLLTLELQPMLLSPVQVRLFLVAIVRFACCKSEEARALEQGMSQLYVS